MYRRKLNTISIFMGEAGLKYALLISKQKTSFEANRALQQDYKIQLITHKYHFIT